MTSWTAADWRENGLRSSTAWDECPSPNDLLRTVVVPGLASPRKCRLAGVGFARLFRPVFPTADPANCVGCAELYAGGAVSRDALAAAYAMASTAIRNSLPGDDYQTYHAGRLAMRAFADTCLPDDMTGPGFFDPPLCVMTGIGKAIRELPDATRPGGVLGFVDGHFRMMCLIVRDVMGDPFRPVRFDADWRTSTVQGLAHVIYQNGAFDRLPVLADALEEAGCDEPAVLDHCRGDDSHVRGCWAVDLTLGIESPPVVPVAAPRPGP